MRHPHRDGRCLQDATDDVLDAIDIDALIAVRLLCTAARLLSRASSSLPCQPTQQGSCGLCQATEEHGGDIEQSAMYQNVVNATTKVSDNSKNAHSGAGGLLAMFASAPIGVAECFNAWVTATRSAGGGGAMSPVPEEGNPGLAGHLPGSAGGAPLPLLGLVGVE